MNLALVFFIFTGRVLLLSCCAGAKTQIKHVISKKTFFHANISENDLPDNVISKNGYKAEVHSVVTPDGYILPMYRIPYGKKTRKQRRNPPVLMLAGFTQSAYSFFYVNPKQILPFILADAGFDVWVGNYRGSKDGSHERFSKKQTRYWKFSFDEISKHDVTSNIDYILNTTKRTALHYIGHSLGASVGFFAIASQPRYNPKIKKFVGLGAGVRMENTKSFFNLLRFVNLRHFVKRMDFWFNGQVPLHLLAGPTEKAGKLCLKMGLLPQCAEILLSSFSASRTNTATILRAKNHFLPPVSARVLAQIGSIVKGRSNSMYDYGDVGNIKVYGKKDPPVYDLKQFTVPCLIINGPRDAVFVMKDAKRTLDELGSKSKELRIVKRKDFTHADFIFDENVKEVVWNDVLKYLLN